MTHESPADDPREPPADESPSHDEGGGAPRRDDSAPRRRAPQDSEPVGNSNDHPPLSPQGPAVYRHRDRSAPPAAETRRATTTPPVMVVASASSGDEVKLSTGRRRRVKLPVFLFLATCVCTFWAGAAGWEPLTYASSQGIRQRIFGHWDQGLLYMAAVLAILLAHEMGHFVATLVHRIPASLPYFLPLPITPIGTMGAVIGMDSMRADRREMFDIGLAGPLAGLVIAIPVTLWGASLVDFTEPARGAILFHSPWLIDMMFGWLQVEGYTPGQAISLGHMNPLLMAGWVGLLITGLNMLPVSQLDGGHVIYTLFGKRAHAIARAFIFVAMVYIVYWDLTMWTVMLILVILIGTDHPPTRDDTVPLGRVRTALGYGSLVIPLLCFPAAGIEIVMP